MAKAVPAVRLRGKQPCPQRVKKNGQKSKGKQTKPKRDTIRCQALKDGLLPPARRPFALFVKDNVRGQKGGGRSEWRLEMKRLGAMWHKLPIDQKKRYFDQSNAEFAKQHFVMKQMGMPLRKSSSRTTHTLAKDVLPEPEDPVMIGGYKVVNADPGLPDCHPLGEGAYGSVFPCLDKLQRRCAVKVFKKKSALEDLNHELVLLQAVQEQSDQKLRGFYPCILEAQPCFKPFPFLALEYCGSSLFSLLGEKGAFSVDDSRAIALQLKAAVRGLHSLQILHLDLKTSNVLWCVVRRELKLADFGMSEYIPGYGRSIRFPMYVTASYRAPELWHAAQRDLSKWLGPAVDLWSFGCVLYEVAVGKILMRPLRNNLCGCENTIKEWCQQWQSLQKSLQGSIRPSLSNAQVSRNFDYRLVNRLHLLEPSFRPAIKAMLNPDPAQRDWAGID